MKHTQKGSTVALLLVIIALLVIGFGWYVYQNNTKEIVMVPVPQTTQTIQTPVPTTPVVNTPVAAASLCPQNQTWIVYSGCVGVSQLASLRQYKDAVFGFSFPYPQTWSVSKQSSGDISVFANDPAVKTITLHKVSGTQVTDSNGHFGSVSYYYANNQWYMTGTNERTGGQTEPTVVQPFGYTTDGSPIFTGSILSHGFGSYVYIVALSHTNFLVVSGLDTDTLLSFVKSIK